LSEKTALDLLDDADAALKHRTQRRFCSIAGCLFLLAHALTQVPLLLLAAIGCFAVAVVRHVQLRALAGGAAEAGDDAPDDADDDGPADPTLMEFAAAAVSASLEIELGGRAYVLAVERAKEDWEGTDILRCEHSGRSVFLHPQAFFRALRTASGRFLHGAAAAEAEGLRQQACIAFGYLEDSRDHVLVRVEGRPIAVHCKYLCPVFHVVQGDAGAVLVVEGLRDEHGDEVPPFVTTLAPGVLQMPSAVFDEADDDWVAIEA
jgi:hypothetical protein